MFAINATRFFLVSVLFGILTEFFSAAEIKGHNPKPAVIPAVCFKKSLLGLLVRLFMGNLLRVLSKSTIQLHSHSVGDHLLLISNRSHNLLSHPLHHLPSWSSRLNSCQDYNPWLLTLLKFLVECVFQ